MKKIFTLLFIFSLVLVSAQSSWEKTFQAKITEIEHAKTPESFTRLINYFEHPAVENSSWHSYYYAAYTALKQADFTLRNNDTVSAIPIIEKAEKNLEKIAAYSSANSEIRALFAYLNIMKISSGYAVDQELFLKEAKKYLYHRDSVDPYNPRMDLMRAQLNYVLAQKSGTGKNINEQFMNAAARLKKYQAKNPADPNWGLTDAQYYISKTGKQAENLKK